MEPLIGVIMMWGGNYLPKGWLPCDGRLLMIGDFQALYSLLGTAYGGDGITTFSLPNFTGRIPIGSGITELGQLHVGEKIGTYKSEIIFSESMMTAHTHDLVDATAIIPNVKVGVEFMVSQDPAETSMPQNGCCLSAPAKVLGKDEKLYKNTTGELVSLSGMSEVNPTLNVKSNGTVSATGKGLPIKVTNMQPCMGFDFIIAYDGVYPQRH